MWPTRVFLHLITWRIKPASKGPWHRFHWSTSSNQIHLPLLQLVGRPHCLRIHSIFQFCIPCFFLFHSEAEFHMYARRGLPMAHKPTPWKLSRGQIASCGNIYLRTPPVSIQYRTATSSWYGSWKGTWRQSLDLILLIDPVGTRRKAPFASNFIDWQPGGEEAAAVDSYNPSYSRRPSMQATSMQVQNWRVHVIGWKVWTYTQSPKVCPLPDDCPFFTTSKFLSEKIFLFVNSLQMI